MMDVVVSCVPPPSLPPPYAQTDWTVNHGDTNQATAPHCE